MAKEKRVSAQLVLQNYMLERFLERVSLSQYRGNFIIKGGFLIASMVGLGSRATMDMDATIKGYPVNREAIQYMVEGILAVPVGDGVSFGLKGGRATAIPFMDALRFIAIETHVADARSCILHPASHTHRQLTDEQLAAAGIPVGLVRLSCGIEDAADLIADLEQAFSKAKA